MAKIIFLALLASIAFGTEIQKKPYDDVKKLIKNSGKYSVVVLGTDYCPFCKMTMESIQKLDPKYDTKAQFFYVNIDFDEEAKSDYAVRATPNIVFFAPDGKLLEKRIGGMNEIGFAKRLDGLK
jgi:thiol-disulfide isomerase/thioredoxin